jgi:phage-related protein
LETDVHRGAGIREIRVRESSGAYRLLYVAQFEEAVYVLHVFQKKEQKTCCGRYDTGSIAVSQSGSMEERAWPSLNIS